MKNLKNPGFIIRMAIAAGYIVLAVILLLHPEIINFLSRGMVYAFCTLIIIYGSFRGYRALQLLKNED